MNAADSYSSHLEHLELEEIVERDVRGIADEQEKAYLRREDNLSAWRSALGSLNSSLEKELGFRKKRLAERERLYENHPADPEIESAYLKDRGNYEDAKQQIKWNKETIQERLAENKALRQRRHERLMAGGSHRDLLLKARAFLATDEAIAYVCHIT